MSKTSPTWCTGKLKVEELNKMRKVILSFVAVLLFLAGFFAGQLLKGSAQNVKEECTSTLSFINKRLGCDTRYVISKASYAELRDRLVDYIKREEEAGNASVVSIYFRDLHNGPTLGINQNTSFIPASLLKVPLLITLFSLEEEEPDLMKKEIIYKSLPTQVEQELSEIEPLKEGESYSINTLIERMIVYSDNSSYDLLQAFLVSEYPDKDLFLNTMKELGLVFPRDASENAFTTKTYASLYRQLYNASFLSYEKSEKALDLLSRTTFKQGLPSGMPESVKISHKFGRRTNLPNNGVQLHDCGIVYFPQNPYLLCIMTRGTNETNLTKIISHISKDIYEEVESRRIR